MSIIFYLKQQSNVLQCFCSLKFEKRLFSDKFLSFIFCSSYSWKKPNKIFCSKLARKITFFYTQTAAWLYFCCHKLRIFKPAKSCKVLFSPFSEPYRVLKCIKLWFGDIKLNTSSKHKKTKAIENFQDS